MSIANFLNPDGEDECVEILTCSIVAQIAGQNNIESGNLQTAAVYPRPGT